MTPAQILTIVLATVPTMITVVFGILVNNAQLSDFKSAAERRFNDLDSHMDLCFNDLDRRLEDMKPSR
jgi:hypothetical protein